MILSIVFALVQIAMTYVQRNMNIDSQTSLLLRSLFVLLWFIGRYIVFYIQNKPQYMFTLQHWGLHIFRGSLIYLIMLFSYIARQKLNPSVSAAIGSSEILMVLGYSLIFGTANRSFNTLRIALMGFLGLLLLGNELSLHGEVQFMVYALLSNLLCASTGFVTKYVFDLEKTSDNTNNNEDNSNQWLHIQMSLLLTFILCIVGFILHIFSFNKTVLSNTSSIYILLFAIKDLIYKINLRVFLLGILGVLATEISIRIFTIKDPIWGKIIDPLTHATIQNIRPVLILMIDIVLKNFGIDSSKNLTLHIAIGIILIILSTLDLSYYKASEALNHNINANICSTGETIDNDTSKNQKSCTRGSCC